jgi:hypothetical protein
MREIKLAFQAALLLIFVLMGAWAYGGSTALDDSRPENPADTEALKEVLEAQETANWYEDANDAPKVAEAKNSEEEAELEQIY